MSNHPYPGFFVSFEGIDYCGKTTQCTRFVDHIKREGWEFQEGREPGAGLPAAEEMRMIILAKHLPTLPFTDLLLFVAARNEAVQRVIKPALERGAVCVFDRYADSTEAYQGHGAGLPLWQVYELNNMVVNRTWPDITFFIDREPRECLEAMLKSEDRRLDAMENVDLLTLMRRRGGYEQAMKRNPDRIVRVPFVDGGQETMEAEIWEHFLTAMKTRNYTPQPPERKMG